jgi:hypothetical protein
MHSTNLLVLIVVGFGLVGCSSSGGDSGTDQGALNGAQSPGCVETNDELGEYKLDPAATGIGGTLIVKSLRPFVFDLTAVIAHGGGGVGSIKNGVADFEERTAFFGPDPDCNIVLSLQSRAVKVQQTGRCESQGFGAYVDASGTYVKR